MGWVVVAGVSGRLADLLTWKIPFAKKLTDLK
jgi:hypothetical protein